jgi:hypothetical protein
VDQAAEPVAAQDTHTGHVGGWMCRGAGGIRSRLSTRRTVEAPTGVDTANTGGAWHGPGAELRIMRCCENMSAGGQERSGQNPKAAEAQRTGAEDASRFPLFTVPMLATATRQLALEVAALPCQVTRPGSLTMLGRTSLPQN